MPKQPVASARLPPPSGHFAQATIAEARGRLLFISGMLAKGPDGRLVGIGDVAAQTRQVCENLKAAVEAAGGTLDDICRMDVYVRNMEHFERIHEVRRAYFTGTPPASTMVEVTKLTLPEALIEISAIAVLP
ncbi:RidA family protein [Caldovatus aquaticus]|uniref:RidA family protein n=1 Tax=Caldovatus aquaticus TaxID=2865671 RepID=A0ABS7EXW9_9PROT|nr:RidA family protein [Caldovatus aquaticus]MBW8268200.1 RidA family protein [Caldovatus aquaticus]